METADIIFNNSHYGGYEPTKMDLLHRKQTEERIRKERRLNFLNGVHPILDKFIANGDGTERPLKLADICFGRPFMGLIKARPEIYGVTSVHYIAGYKIVIKKFEDSSDDIIWYETPVNDYYCKIHELEEIIHEHLLEAIQRDSVWNQLK